MIPLNRQLNRIGAGAGGGAAKFDPKRHKPENELRHRVPILAGVLLIASLTAASDVSFAQSCRDLTNTLARLGGGGTSPEAARYDRAIREQTRVLARAEGQARRASCSGRGFLFFRRKPQPECKSLVPKIRKMKANLAALRQKRDRAKRGGSGGANRAQIARIRELMRQKRCTLAGRFAWLRGDDIFVGEVLPNSGRYRTLCVRTCDGYYFPISFSTSRRRFPADEAMCENMCPGAEVDLFYHNTSGESESMISLAGEAYGDLPNAFRYREVYDKTCSCRIGPALRYTDLATQARPAARQTRIPVPLSRPGLAADPETVLNRFGRFVPRAVATNDTLTAQSGRVRTVGPEYWGAQSREEVLLVPVPN